MSILKDSLYQLRNFAIDHDNQVSFGIAIVAFIGLCVIPTELIL